MNWRKGLFFAITVSSILVLSGITSAQQEVPGEASGVPDVQWLWGEVVSVDTAKSEVLIKYLDYESEQEKQVTVATDDKTTFENVDSLAKIKAADTVSVDYVVDKDGKNLAKNISVEKPEEGGVPAETAPETMPETTPVSTPEVTTQSPQTEPVVTPATTPPAVQSVPAQEPMKQ